MDELEGRALLLSFFLIAGCSGGHGGNPRVGDSAAGVPDSAGRAGAAATALAIVSLLDHAAPAPVALEGMVTVQAECGEHPRCRAFLETAGQRFELAGNEAAFAGLTTGSRVRINGLREGSTLSLGGPASTAIETLTPALTRTKGSQSVAIILIAFSDVALPPDASTEAHAALQDTSDFYRESSYGATSLAGSIYGPLTIDLPSTTTDFEAIADQALAHAGIDVGGFGHLVFAFPRTDTFPWWGLGTIGGVPSRSWINGKLALQVLAHELGHGLGLFHSHSGNAEYGDTFDVMGSSTGHFNAFQKERLGWIGTDDRTVDEVRSTGTYHLDAFESEGGTKAIKVPRRDQVDGSCYYIEARRALGFDAPLAVTGAILAGVLVHVALETDGNSSVLLDLTPTTPTLLDGRLAPGQSLADAAGGLTIRCLDDGSGVVIELSASAAPPSAPGGLALDISRDGSTLTGTARLASVTVTFVGGEARATGTIQLDATIARDGVSGTARGSVELASSDGTFLAMIDMAFQASGTSIVLDGTVDARENGTLHRSLLANSTFSR